MNGRIFKLGNFGVFGNLEESEGNINVDIIVLNPSK